MAAFTLYGARGSTNTDRVRLTLAEGGFVDYDLVLLNLQKGEQKVPDLVYGKIRMRPSANCTALVERARRTSPMGQGTRIDYRRGFHLIREPRHLQVSRGEILISASSTRLRHRSLGLVRPGAVRGDALLR